VLLRSGIDTFSKTTFGEARKALQSYGVPVYAVGLMQAIRIYADAYGMLSPSASLDFLQADNQLRTFANETGGQAFFPRFESEFPSIFRQIANSLRNQYSITYQPSNQTRDGKFRRIKVELVDPQTNKPLRVVDENKKTINYKIITKNGYYAPRPVE
jgi:VWFA-related protein